MMFNRIIVIVLDGVGVGEAPDAHLYGDLGTNSLGNTAIAVGGLNLPNMMKLGLGHITPIMGVPTVENPKGIFGKMKPRSAGKDTISGHWELMGINLPNPLPTYPNGFPDEIIKEFNRKTGMDVLGNKAASGTEIIQELGLEHVQTGNPILYTSADSVFQLAAHEEIIPIEKLYGLCEISRDILTGVHAVGRVIARPFLGKEPGKFWRTERRKDFPLLPPNDTIMDKLINAGRSVMAVGKIDDIFGGRGITESKHTVNNHDGLIALREFMKQDFEGLLFVNLIEFDMIYGHRNDPQGYAEALNKIDESLPILERLMKDTDLAMFVADHGVDPTTPSTDHSREYVPLLIFGKNVKEGVNLGIRHTLSDVGATIAENFSLISSDEGTSFLSNIIHHE